MSATFNLVAAAVGDPELIPVDPRLCISAPHFDLFDVQLPRPRFSGIPQQWVFAVFDKERLKSSETRRAIVLAEAHAIKEAEAGKLVIFVSDDQTVHLADEFRSDSSGVFCLDYPELPHTKNYETQPWLAPFSRAIRSKLNINPVLLLSRTFFPYQLSKPVSGWQFFGREKQLRDIIDGKENLIIVGARRVGKTSLLREATRRLQRENKKAYYVDVQDCESPHEVVREILHVISPREAARAVKHHEVLGETVFSSVLRHLSSGSQETILLLDELGNTLSRMPPGDWGFLGVLRKFAKDKLRFVMSCFQEIYFKQQREFEGPLINLGRTFRLGVFTRREAEEFVVAPLEFWRPLGTARDKLLNLVITSVGTHPYVLQYFCHSLFDRFANDRSFDPWIHTNLLLQRDLHRWFRDAADEIFFRIPSSAVQYLFLRRCQEAEASGQLLNQSDLTDDWVEKALAALGYHSRIRGRRNLLEALEMYGLCSAADYEREKKIIAVPVIYQYVRQTNPSFDSWLVKLGKEIERECDIWELENAQPA